MQAKCQIWKRLKGYLTMADKEGDALKKLWSDDKSFYDVECWHDMDSYAVIFNLYEDIICLKEELIRVQHEH
jgi:hypothetical protein